MVHHLAMTREGPSPPFRSSEAGTPTSNFWYVAPPLKDSKFFYSEAKIVEILMKIVQTEVLFSISGYISLFFDLYNTILAKFSALLRNVGVCNSLVTTPSRAPPYQSCPGPHGWAWTHVHLCKCSILAHKGLFRAHHPQEAIRSDLG